MCLRAAGRRFCSSGAKAARASSWALGRPAPTPLGIHVPPPLSAQQHRGHRGAMTRQADAGEQSEHSRPARRGVGKPQDRGQRGWAGKHRAVRAYIKHKGETRWVGGAQGLAGDGVLVLPRAVQRRRAQHEHLPPLRHHRRRPPVLPRLAARRRRHVLRVGVAAGGRVGREAVDPRQHALLLRREDRAPVRHRRAVAAQQHACGAARAAVSGGHLGLLGGR